MADLIYSPKLPLDVDNDGNFVYLKDVYSNIKQKLRMLFLTNPGEKIMEPNFGIGIKKYLFEHSRIITKNTDFDGTITYSASDLESEIRNNIYSQVNMYLRDISIDDLQVSIEENVLSIVLEYKYKNFLQDTLEMQVSL